MIVSFKHRGLKRLYLRGDRSQIRQDLLDKVENILAFLDAAAAPQALDLPGYRLHRLKGDRKDFWAVTVRANWRIIFRALRGFVWVKKMGRRRGNPLLERVGARLSRGGNLARLREYDPLDLSGVSPIPIGFLASALAGGW